MKDVEMTFGNIDHTSQLGNTISNGSVLDSGTLMSAANTNPSFGLMTKGFNSNSSTLFKHI
jgi:hypothetical protein